MGNSCGTRARGPNVRTPTQAREGVEKNGRWWSVCIEGRRGEGQRERRSGPGSID